ncbi:MAG: universal stress protein [Burkholderiaceae bacterium]
MTDIERKVLACVDFSAYAEHVTDCAAWAANRLQAPLEILHVIDRHPERGATGDRSGALTVNAEEHLLKNLSDEDAIRTRAEREQGRLFLNTLRERAVRAGAEPVDTRQRHGALEETLVEHQTLARLVVLGRRGLSSTGHRELGRSVQWTVRSLRRPVLAVTDRFAPPRRVLIAFDGSSITRTAVDMVAASPLFTGLPVYVLMVGKASADAPRQLEWARSRLDKAGFGVVAEVQSGDLETVVGQAIARHGIDMLVMGAYTHSPLRGLLLGSKTTDLLRSVTVPTLLLR